jgi:hypothetical protein
LAAYPLAQLRYEPECVLRAVAWHMGFNLRWDITAPRVRYESRTPLKEFQDAVERQWGFRSPVFTNAYSQSVNEVFIIDDARYYAKLKRFMDDSLAHEYAHFVQVQYKKFDLRQDDESLEFEAVAEQTWFRETYLSNPQAPDPCVATPR